MASTMSSAHELQRTTQKKGNYRNLGRLTKLLDLDHPSGRERGYTHTIWICVLSALGGRETVSARFRAHGVPIEISTSQVQVLRPGTPDRRRSRAELRYLQRSSVLLVVLVLVVGPLLLWIVVAIVVLLCHATSQQQFQQQRRRKAQRENKGI